MAFAYVSDKGNDTTGVVGTIIKARGKPFATVNGAVIACRKAHIDAATFYITSGLLGVPNTPPILPAVQTFNPPEV